MSGGRVVEGVVVVVLVVLVGSLLVGNALGQPILLSYVETGSMAPTMEPGDGFIAVPTALTGEIEPGDVIVFDAKNLHGGGLTTHRVVAETEQGFITKGDANPFTDQSNEEPPVQRGQIVAEALQFNGGVVVIPGIGTLVEGIRGILSVFGGVLSGMQRWLAALLGTRALLGPQGLAFFLFGAGILVYLSSLAFGSDAIRETGRSNGKNEGLSVPLLIVAFVLLVVTSVTLPMVLPSGTTSFQMVSADNDIAGVQVIKSGTSETTTYEVKNGGYLPVIVFLEPAGEGIDIATNELRIPGGGSADVNVTLHAPESRGLYPRHLSEHWYLAVLPPSVIRGLYTVHPWIPIITIDVVAGIVVALVSVAALGTGRIRFRSSDVALSTRLRRWLR